MNGVNLSDAPGGSGAVVYPDSDGEPMAETGVHLMVMVTLIATLRYYYRLQPDVYVIGNMFLYYREGHSEERKAPDVMVIKGVQPGPERRSFKTWEERASPCVIFEITSPKTAEEDQGEKKQLYQRLGVREYFLFDPLQEYLERPLLGYRLIGKEYEPLPPGADGGLLSAELGLRLVPEGSKLGLFHFRSGERLPPPPEAYELLEELKRQAGEARERLQSERQRAEQERQRAEQERQRAEQAEEQTRQAQQRAEELAAELARLRKSQPPQEGEA